MDTIMTMISNIGLTINKNCVLMYIINTTIKKKRETIQQNTILLEKISAFLEKEETHDGKEN